MGIVAVALVLVVGGVVGGIVLFRGLGNDVTPVPTGAPWGGQAALTQADLKQVDPVMLWARMFKAQAMQPVVRTKREHYMTERRLVLRKNSSLLGYQTYDVAFDYRTKQFNYSSDYYTTSYLSTTRCVGRDGYIYMPHPVLPDEWELRAPDDAIQCNRTLFNLSPRLNDGIATGGLNAEQANTFVGTLIAATGEKGNKLITAERPTLVERKGKQYVRLVVHATPVLHHDDTYWGLQRFIWAFHDTGLDAKKHPYIYVGAGGAGLLMIYNIDPATMLPVYAEFHQGLNLGPDGQPELDQVKFSHRRVEYFFGGKVPKPTVDAPPKRIKLSWPPEKLR